MPPPSPSPPPPPSPPPLPPPSPPPPPHHHHRHHQKPTFFFWLGGPITFKNQNIGVFILFRGVLTPSSFIHNLSTKPPLFWPFAKSQAMSCTLHSAQPPLSQITIFTASTNLFRALMGRQPPTAEFCTFPTSGCCSPRWLSLLRGPTFLHLTHFKPRHSLT